MLQLMPLIKYCDDICEPLGNFIPALEERKILMILNLVTKISVLGIKELIIYKGFIGHNLN